MERFDAAQARVATLQAPFSLTIRRAMLKTPTVTKGTLFLQESDFVHFAFAPPEDLVLHLTSKALDLLQPRGRGRRTPEDRVLQERQPEVPGAGTEALLPLRLLQVTLGKGKEVPGGTS